MASVVLIAACGPRELTYNDVQAMTEDEKIVACREAWDLRSKTTGPCNSIENLEHRNQCVRQVRWQKNAGLMNYIMLDCTRVKFLEPASGS